MRLLLADFDAQVQLIGRFIHGLWEFFHFGLRHRSPLSPEFLRRNPLGQVNKAPRPSVFRRRRTEAPGTPGGAL